MTIRQQLQSHRAEILSIGAKHGAKNIRFFGSIARNEAGAKSDIDLLVDAGPQTSAWFPAGLALDLEDLLGRKVDVVTENALHWYIRERVLKEAQPV